MIERYTDSEIAKIWTDENKTALWQKTEIAALWGKAFQKVIPLGIPEEIEKILNSKPVDLSWWKKRESETHHDLVAFVDERVRHLPIGLRKYFHADDMTSFDTEDPAFVTMLGSSCKLVLEGASNLEKLLIGMACGYRHTLMLARTHGQGAELQSFGKECLTWLAICRTARGGLELAMKNLEFSKLSGAIGGYGGISPEVEEETLRMLSLRPYYGATQIVPRILYAPVAQALCDLVHCLNKIALDIRLGARSPRPIYQEPFAKKQMGSSAMPHKRNPVNCEQVEGMARLALGCMVAITQNIATWEERSIEQSSVERVAWPDLFHITMRAIKVMTKVLAGLKVYPDNMLREIYESRGCYASGKAKEFLAELLEPRGVDREEATRIIQLAAFNAHEPSELSKKMRDQMFGSLEECKASLNDIRQDAPSYASIAILVLEGRLHCSEMLEANEETVARWNLLLRESFGDPDVSSKWSRVFDPEYLLRNEPFLFTQILGEETQKGAE